MNGHHVPPSARAAGPYRTRLTGQLALHFKTVRNGADANPVEPWLSDRTDKRLRRMTRIAAAALDRSQ
jgi:hypothetical protein